MIDKTARWLMLIVVAGALIGGFLSGCSDDTKRTPEQITRIQHIM